MKKRKILSLFLSLCLLIGLLPTVALAADQVAAESGVRITEAGYDSTNSILTINVDIKMPNSTGIKSVGSLISYDSSKLTLLHKTKNTITYTPSDPRTSVKPSVVVQLTNSDDELYSTDGGVDLYGTGNRAGLFVGLGTTGQPSEEQKTTDWLTIYQLRFKVSGNAADVLNSDSLRIADPAVDNDVIKGAYPANNKFVISVDSGDSIGYKYGKMQGYTGGDVGGNNYVMNSANVTATYPGSTKTTPPAPATLTGISVKTAPTKLTYNEGESFDKTGMVIEATYNDGSTKDVTGYTYTPTGALTTADTTISISYTEGSETKTCTQSITVNAVTPPAPATLTGISVKTAPTKLTYNEGESFDKTGMVIEATYNDGSTKDVTGYTYTPTGALTTADTTISISYTEGSETKTCTQAITVNAVTPPAPTEYTITFNVNGGSGTIPPQLTSGQKLSSLPTATRSGSYSFDGWYTAASGGTQITTAYVFSGNTTVYAHWTYTGGGGGGSYTPSYTVSVDKTENGTITVSPKSASKGDTVTITVKPDKGYELEMLKALDKDGDALKLTEKNGKYTFKMPSGKVTVKGSFVEEAPVQIFKDVPTDAYYYEAVKWAAEKGITGGVGNGLFAPNQPCTRAQIVTFLWRAAGSPAPKNMSSFADVPADAFYAKAVAWAVENGITGGTGDGKFSPDATCTRAQSVTFLYRAAGSPKVSGSAEFGDVATNAYYADAVAWAAKNGITGGIGGGLFGSDNNCTRAQIVTFLYRSVK